MSRQTFTVRSITNWPHCAWAHCHHYETEFTISGCDEVLLPGLLLIFLHGCKIKSGWGLRTRLAMKCLMMKTSMLFECEPLSPYNHLMSTWHHSYDKYSQDFPISSLFHFHVLYKLKNKKQWRPGNKAVCIHSSAGISGNRESRMAHKGLTSHPNRNCHRLYYVSWALLIVFHNHLHSATQFVGQIYIIRS